MFQHDYATVFNADLQLSADDGIIYLGTIGFGAKAETFVSEDDIAQLTAHEEAFLIQVIEDKLIVLGSDKRGTAYGMLELSRMIGVSPWVWWADSPVSEKESFTLKNGYRDIQYPSVARRGIFLNDEDWGLMPWSSQNYEASDVDGQIGPKTHARIFELLLRLRANTLWPAMHKCSEAFYLTPGNKEMADKYGIYIGTSHCEPMACNANYEWRRRGEGKYDYVNNRENVLKFWEERVSSLSNSDNIYTLGIRGEHDGRMQGAKSIREQRDAIAKIFKDQRDMIAKYVNPDVEKVSQVFIPYKEVLYAYNLGLEVPEDVTLMWTDDNYGYIRHYPDSAESARKGGNGVYYHISYWGRPHDYLWLATNHPAQLYTQMKMAWDKGARDMWILNVGDIKPAEYLTELFMDMAWSIDSIQNNKEGLDKHLWDWLAREFGRENADDLLQVMNEYYRLAYIRKPEFMGNTRTEERDPGYKVVSDLPWSKQDIENRIRNYQQISDRVKHLAANIPLEKQASWFELIEYPVLAAAEMNFKHLYGQLARHGLADWSKSDAAYEEIVALTEKYNSLLDGKWNKMMDDQPRRLAVFQRVIQTVANEPLAEELKPLAAFNGNDYASFTGSQPIAHGLGYQRGAIQLAKGSSVIYKFESQTSDSLAVEVNLAPNHPVAGDKIRYGIAIDGEPGQVVDYTTKGRSEEWKLNVLRNQAIRNTTHLPTSSWQHSIKITALDEGVFVDQIKIREK
ncbi:glycosyl hydrolase 115 family protein [Mangrovibacterium marinum]|uniref:Glycosyl hydrolase family 115 (Putative glucuronidase) n=1 Tax=Mangrovibacterium marinum TaxID=1639118 RepID=A0A2T5BXN8_9BACT|nr:glycosyl hydrolase 115 family protein [Mangrovibacterium marinum]PTN05911.1 glycosyl hydrolase family 115 (putative glucuronidase) [Mangrovibacterium marinum]